MSAGGEVPMGEQRTSCQPRNVHYNAHTNPSVAHRTERTATNHFYSKDESKALLLSPLFTHTYDAQR